MLALDAAEGMDLLCRALEREEEEKLFARWINGYQHMSFAAFKGALTPPDRRDEGEILDDVGRILTAWEGVRDGTV